ncbi:MAG: phosphotransferase [Actinomycetaceae bacterium]|nr:phosphotransferase [Actinomycetaceae bacterium]
MKKPLTNLQLAAVASAVLPRERINATCEPTYRDDDIALQGVTTDNGEKYLVTCPLGNDASTDLQTQEPLLNALHSLYRRSLLSFDVPVPIGFTRLRTGQKAMVAKGFDAPLLESIATGTTTVGTSFSFSEGNNTPDTNSGSLFPIQAWAKPLAIALASLHRTELQDVASASLPINDAASIRQELHHALAQGKASGHIPQTVSKRWQQRLDNPSLWRFSSVLIHSNIAPTCVFGSADGIVGICDWGEAQFGDPAVDLAAVLSGATPKFSKEFYRVYRLQRRSGVDGGLESRVELMAELAILRWLLHGLECKDAEIINDAATMMTELNNTLEQEATSYPDNRKSLKDVPSDSHEPTQALPTIRETDNDEALTEAVHISDIDGKNK